MLESAYMLVEVEPVYMSAAPVARPAVQPVAAVAVQLPAVVVAAAQLPAAVVEEVELAYMSAVVWVMEQVYTLAVVSG